jgi:integrase
MKRNTQSAGDLAAAVHAGVKPAGGGWPAMEPSPEPGVRDGSITLRSLIGAYMGAYNGRDTTRQQRLAWWVNSMGSVSVAELSDDSIFAAIENLSGQRGRYFAGRDADGRPVMKAKRKPLAPATVNRYQAALSAVLTWAQRRRMTPKDWHNPCRTLGLRPEHNEIVRFLSDVERIKLLNACRASKWPMLYVLVLMALTTGARRGELEALTWGDIDLGRAEASIAQTKNNDRKVLPLVPAVVEELKRLQPAKAKASEIVFKSRRRSELPFNFDPAWDKAKRASGVRNFRFHDLRHSCASYLAQSGAPLLQIAEVLGHRQLSVTRRYSHLTTSHKAELVGRVLGSIR